MGRFSRTIVAIGYLVALTVLAIDATLVYASLMTITRSNRLVDHSRQVVIQLERAFSILKDAETGQRGYLLTGRDEYLEPFRTGELALEPTLAVLRSLTSDDAPQSALSAELERLARAKMAELRTTIALRRERGLDSALEVVRTGRGRSTMSEARRVVADSRNLEDQKLTARTAASQAAVRGTLITFAVTTGLALLLLIAVSYLQRRETLEREDAAAAVRKSEAWLATILTSIGDGVIATDERGHVRLMNPVAQALTGWGQDEAAGRPMEEVFAIINEQTRQAVDSPVAAVIREGRIVGLANHTILVARDGTERPIDDSAAPIRDAMGKITGVVLVFRDVTERKQLETERARLLVAAEAARAEAEEANQAKDQFLAVLSHELRTPLNPILLATTAMLERPTPAEEVRPNLEMIRQNVNLQARLIDDLLDVMRIVRGKMPLHWEVADCHDVIQQAVQICRSEFLGKGLQLTVELAAARHFINADPARLQQVFWNLIKNSVKFTPSGGTITIQTRNSASDNPGGDRLIVTVTDSGIGIEPTLLTRIFDPFQQGESSITRRFGGMGLGLAISKGIIEGHGGLLTAQSQGKDQGTTFTIELQALPACRPPDNGRSRAARAAEPPAPACLKILLVEDEQTTLRLMARLVRALGHEVTTAGTIGSALDAERTGDFDLIISDIGLPDGSGLELMRQVVARRGRVPAIALTGYGMEEDIQRSRDAGFTAHMTKPIDFVKLEAMIRQVAS